MTASLLTPFLLLLLIPTPRDTENPWKDRVPQRVPKTAAKIVDALDVAWRADDWQAGARFADALREHKPTGDAALARLARAYWRAGRLQDAEAAAGRIAPTTNDRLALRVLSAIHLARGETEQAARLAKRLERQPDLDAEDLYQIINARFALDRMPGMPDLLRLAERRIDESQGYPHIYLEESLSGVAAFLEDIGPRPLNEISAAGSAPIKPLVLGGLPTCDVTINGYGPYKLVLDTGGSIMVSLDETIAREIGLKNYATATVRGVSGSQVTGQSIIDDLRIGSIRCTNVMTRTFDIRSALMNAADGIIGTGIFTDGTMTLDFADAELRVKPGSSPGSGHEVPVRIVGDAKLITNVTLEGEQSLAMLDTGAEVIAASPISFKRLFPDRKVQQLDLGQSIGVGSGAIPEVALNAGADMVFADRKFENAAGLSLDALDTLISPIVGVQFDVLIGMPAFREMRSLTIDYPQARMWIMWVGD